MQLGEDRSDEVWQKCAGCLMVLAGNSEKNKERISYKEKAGPRGRGGRARARAYGRLLSASALLAGGTAT